MLINCVDPQDPKDPKTHPATAHLSSTARSIRAQAETLRAVGNEYCLPRGDKGTAAMGCEALKPAQSSTAFRTCASTSENPVWVS